MPDFTINLLPQLYKALQSQGFSFFSVSNILQKNEISSKYVILRHDVEKYYENALEFARIQNELGIRGVYGDEETEGLRDGERGREGEGATGRWGDGKVERWSSKDEETEVLREGETK